MKKLLIALIAVVVVGGVAFAVFKKDNHDTMDMSKHENMPAQSHQSQSQPSEVQSGQVAVDITNFAFSPQTLKVKKGTKVTWTNHDSTPHTVTSDPDSDNNRGLNSPNLDKDGTYSFTFTKAGTYKYHCSFHPYMTASVEVVE